jgi:2-keto-4-pentenoate hydratase/2-oxohepta-3-ene-1,7-dioic acid hydratase in catechol pathway
MILTGTPNNADFVKGGDVLETSLRYEDRLLMSMLTPVI